MAYNAGTTDGTATDAASVTNRPTTGDTEGSGRRARTRRSAPLRTALAAALIAVPVAIAAASAPASAAGTEAVASADDGGHAVHYTAGTGQNNRVVITETRGTEFTIDDVVPITAGTDCVHPDAEDLTKVTCTLGEWGDYWVRISVDLGDKDDDLTIRAGNENSVHGGAGNDTLNGSGVDNLYGDDGDDTLQGGSQLGGNGADLLSAPDYGGNGGPGNDTLVGTDGPDTLTGGTDHDTLIGRAGDDTLYGNSGNDTLLGGGGTDKLSGGTGVNRVIQ